jgi:hypothetical protein
MDKYEQELLNKIDSEEPLSRSELCELREYKIEQSYGDNMRWYREVETICEIGDRYFCLNWYQGLTEMQDDEFDYQPFEVKKHTYEKTITVTEWVSKK